MLSGYPIWVPLRPVDILSLSVDQACGVRLLHYTCTSTEYADLGTVSSSRVT